jgi:hypothetical protein
VYFTPTSGSWLNMVERFFRNLTQNRLRRGVFQAWVSLASSGGGAISSSFPPEMEIIRSESLGVGGNSHGGRSDNRGHLAFRREAPLDVLQLQQYSLGLSQDWREVACAAESWFLRLSDGTPVKAH